MLPFGSQAVSLDSLLEDDGVLVSDALGEVADSFVAALDPELADGAALDEAAELLDAVVEDGVTEL